MMITNPIFVVKTRLQLQAQTQLPENHYKGVIDAMSKISRIEGFRAFYKGIIPCLFSSSHGAIQFTTYELLSNTFLQYFKNDQITSFNSFICGGISKIAAMVVTFPFTLVRSRLQEQRGSDGLKYTGFNDALFKIFKKEGFFGFYKGLGPSFWRLVFSSGLFFLIFEKVKIGISHFSIFTN